MIYMIYKTILPHKTIMLSGIMFELLLVNIRYNVITNTIFEKYFI
jgi:hypothetical protein